MSNLTLTFKSTKTIRNQIQRNSKPTTQEKESAAKVLAKWNRGFNPRFTNLLRQHLCPKLEQTQNISAGNSDTISAQILQAGADLEIGTQLEIPRNSSREFIKEAITDHVNNNTSLDGNFLIYIGDLNNHVVKLSDKELIALLSNNQPILIMPNNTEMKLLDAMDADNSLEMLQALNKENVDLNQISMQTKLKVVDSLCEKMDDCVQLHYLGEALKDMNFNLETVDQMEGTMLIVKKRANITLRKLLIKVLKLNTIYS